MRPLYQINEDLTAAIKAATDPETGEVRDASAIEALNMERDAKIEGVALWRKDLVAENSAMKAEIEQLRRRVASNENTINGLDWWVADALGGSKFSTARCAVSFIKSQAVKVDENLLPKKYLVKKVTFTPDKVQLKNLLKAGKKIKGAQLVDNLNVQIK